MHTRQKVNHRNPSKGVSTVAHFKKNGKSWKIILHNEGRTSIPAELISVLTFPHPLDYTSILLIYGTLIRFDNIPWLSNSIFSLLSVWEILSWLLPWGEFLILSRHTRNYWLQMVICLYSLIFSPIEDFLGIASLVLWTVPPFLRFLILGAVCFWWFYYT